MFGRLETCSLEQLLARAEMRLRLVERRIGDPLVHELDAFEIGAELRRRRDNGVPVS